VNIGFDYKRALFQIMKIIPASFPLIHEKANPAMNKSGSTKDNLSFRFKKDNWL
jgi:hypothetical protein